MQKYNKHNCNLFNKITKDYNNALDKINYIRSFLPGMYTQLFNFSKTENLFMFYKKTSNHLFERRYYGGSKKTIKTFT